MSAVADLEDATLVRYCLSGHGEAIRVFVQRFQSTLFAVCIKILGHRHDAEDVTQEVLLRAFRGLSGFDSRRPLRPWLTMIAVNCCRTLLASRKVRPVAVEYSDDLSLTQRPEHDFDLAEELQNALATLREDYRICFVLFHEQQLSLPEISEIVGSPVGTIKTWLHRARRQLSVHLMERGITPMVNHELH